MKFLRDYDEVLDSTVMSILEQNFVEGIRSANQTAAVDHEPITVVPGNLAMFPNLTQAEIDETFSAPRIKMLSDNSNSITEISAGDWAAAGLEDATDKYITGIGHYNKRMMSVVSKSTSWARVGAVAIADFVESIFSRLESLRDAKATKQLKQRALVDLFKCLKEQGFSSMKWSVPYQIRESHQLLQLPAPSLNDAPRPTREMLEKGESYFHRCQVEISRIRSEISMLGSQYMSQREMTLMQGYSDHMLFLLCQERCVIADMIQTVSGFDSFFDRYGGISDSIPMNQEELLQGAAKFDDSLLQTIEGLRQLVLLIKEASSLVGGDDRNKVRDAVTILTGCAQKLEEAHSPSRAKSPISHEHIHMISNEMSQILVDGKRDVVSCLELCGDTLPPSIFEACIYSIDESLELARIFAQSVNKADSATPVNEEAASTLNLISALVQSALISAQSICTSGEDTSKNCVENDVKVYESHAKMISEWEGLQLSHLNEKMHALSEALLSLHNNGASNESIRSLCTRTALNSFALVGKVLQLSKSRLQDAAVFYRQHAKLLYVLLRVFRNLIAKGFCADDVSDGGEGDGEGGAGEMKFEDDVEGTGMVCVELYLQ